MSTSSGTVPGRTAASASSRLPIAPLVRAEATRQRKRLERHGPRRRRPGRRHGDSHGAVGVGEHAHPGAGHSLGRHRLRPRRAPSRAARRRTAPPPRRRGAPGAVERDGAAVLDEHGLEHAERRVGPLPVEQRALDRAARIHAQFGGYAGRSSGRPTDPPIAAIGPAALVERLGELLLGIGVGHDRAADAHPDRVAGGLEGADHDARVEPGDRAGDPDRARVDLAPGRLERRDHLHRLDLRRPGHRAGRERGAQQLAVAHAVAQAAGHGRDQVPHAGVGLDSGRERLHRSVRAHPAEVVAHQVDDHHVLGGVLGRREQRLARGPPVVVGAGSGARPLDRLGPHVAPLAPQEALGREAHDSPDQRPEPRLGHRQSAREQIERVAVVPRLQTHAQIRLVQLADLDPAPAIRDRVEVSTPAVGGEDERRRHAVRDGRRRPDAQPLLPDRQAFA